MSSRGTSLSLKLLGGCSLEGPDGLVTGRGTQRRRLSCLAAVAAAGPRGIARDKLMALLWPESDDERARASLRDTLYVLRATLGEDGLLAVGDRIALNLEVVACDVAAFEEALGRGDHAPAVAVYGGPFLDGFHISDAPEYERWVDAERVRLEGAFAGALEVLARKAEREGEAANAVERWQRLATLRPYDSRVARMLVDALDVVGDRAGAIRHVQAHAALLRADLAIEPDRALLERAEQLRSGSRGPHPERPRTSRSVGEPTAATRESVPVPIGEPGARAERSARQRRPRHLILATLAAAAVLTGVGTYRWLRARSLTQSTGGVLSAGGAVAFSGERILVADFAESASDTLLGDAISEALRLGLARSSALRVVGRPTVAEALRRMRRPSDALLDPEVAREVAVREGIKGVIQGHVRQGGSYLITAALEVAATGERVQAWSVTARDSTGVPAAIERLVELIRQHAGESLAAIEPAERPWSRTQTTSSLPALGKHLAGMRAFWRGEYLRSADLQEEAIALDPDFANAYLMLGSALSSAGPTDTRVLKAWTRAYELRDQLTASEHYAAVALHALYVTGSAPAAIDAFRSHIEAARRTGAGTWDASFGEALMAAGHVPEAVQVLQEARRAFPTPRNQLGLASALVRLGRLADAQAVVAEALGRFPGQPSLVLARAQFAAISGDYAAAHAIADTVYASPSGRVPALSAQAGFDATRGRLREAIVHLRALEREQGERGLADEALGVAAAVAMLRLRLGEGPAGAAELDSVLSRQAGVPDPVSYPHFRLARFFAAAGRPARAEALIGRYLRSVPTELRGPDLRDLHRTRAAVRLAEGRPRDALAELREAATHPRLRAGLFDTGPLWSHYIPVEASPELARVYDRLGMRDSAVAVYDRYLGARDLYRNQMDALELGDALVRLVELREAAGDREGAARARRQLAELWSDADPELRRAAEAGARHAAARDPR